MNYLKLCWNIT